MDAVTRRSFVRSLAALGGGLPALAGTAHAEAPAPATEQASAQPGGTLTKSRLAFQRLLATLAEIDREWIGEARNISTRDIHLAHRALAMVLWGALDQYVENDPTVPHFVRLISPFRKWGDNPDGIYFFAPLDVRYSYRVRGRAGAEIYRSLTVHGGDVDGRWPTRVVSDLNSRDMKVDAEGKYEIAIAAERPAGFTGAWLELAPDSGGVIARFYFQNETPAAADPSMVPELTIEPFEPLAKPPASPSDAEVGARLDRVANWVRSKTNGMVIPTLRPMPAWYSTVPNVMGKPTHWRREQSGSGAGAVDAVYAAGPYALAPDEAMVMEGRLPRALYAGVTLWNAFGQTEDYRHRTVSLNRAQLQLDTGDRYRVVIAHRDPRVPNWLDTAGRPKGTVYWRFMLPEEQPRAPTCRVVRLSELVAMRNSGG